MLVVADDLGLVAILDLWRQAENELRSARTPATREQWQLEAARRRADYLRAIQRAHERGRVRRRQGDADGL
jgi:hypothetical protein